MDYKVARDNMVNSQLRTNSISNEAIIGRLQEVERQNFVPKAYMDIAYLDEDIPIGEGRVMIEPLLAAHFIQSAEIKPSDEVLVVAAGLGYELALMSTFTNSIVAVEDNISLRRQAEENLSRQSIDSIAFVTSAQNNEGVNEQAPFDIIIILGSVEFLPDVFMQQLRTKGRLLYIERKGAVGRLKKIIKADDGDVVENIRDASTLILPKFSIKKEFAF